MRVPSLLWLWQRILLMRPLLGKRPEEFWAELHLKENQISFTWWYILSTGARPFISTSHPSKAHRKAEQTEDLMWVSATISYPSAFQATTGLPCRAVNTSYTSCKPRTRNGVSWRAGCCCRWAWLELPVELGGWQGTVISELWQRET